MIPFDYLQPATIGEAHTQLAEEGTMPLAGGTTLLDLMKLNVLTPSRVSFVKPVLNSAVTLLPEKKLTVGAGCTMSQLADHATVKDKLPAVRQSLILAASPQIRNMATIGGNLLQRTRSPYFRHTDMPIDIGDQGGVDRDGVDTSMMAILGNGGRLVGMYPGDFAVTLVAFKGNVVVSGEDGERKIAARDFYQLPQDNFQYTTALRDGELIVAVELPITRSLQQSLYLKVRDRSSYAFALASASVGLQLDGNGDDATIVAANVGLGGVGSIPWTSPEAESALIGQPATDDTFVAAAEAALNSAEPPPGLEFKVPLAKRTLVRALQILRDQGPLGDQQLWAMQHGRG